MKNVLVSPLDWGLGHATRCIPIIRELLKRHCNVSVAGSGNSLELVRTEFPSLSFHSIAAYNPQYPSGRVGMVWKMTTQIPKFLNTINTEHKQIENIIKENKIDLIISDNRYGCWSKKIPSVFITHQSNILMPKRFGLLEGVIRRMNENYMRKFTECWIPDYADGNNLSGQLNLHARPGDYKFIGPLSRFKLDMRKKKMRYLITAVISGPEPQRTIFEKIVRHQFKSSSLPYCVVRGVFGLPSETNEENVFNNLTSDRLQDVIESSEFIVARSGYSTVMDMAALQKRVIFIPTPGQTEQEYLAKRMMDKRIAFSTEQHNFNLARALLSSKDYSGFSTYVGETGLLESTLSETLQFYSNR